jgi:hypothetical protein
MWPKVYNRMIAALVIAQFTILGVFSLKLFYPGIIATAPLPILSVLFALHTTKKYFARSRFLPVSEFPPVFRKGGEMARVSESWDHLESQDVFADAYKDPAMEDTY